MPAVRQINTYEELQNIIKESGKEYDRVAIGQAFRLAERKHRDQKLSLIHI